MFIDADYYRLGVMGFIAINHTRQIILLPPAFEASRPGLTL